MSVFPIPFSPFEYYYYLDDGPEYPTTFPVVVRFSGTLDRQRFLAALTATVERHPLLRATVDDRRRVPSWIAAPQSEPEVDWAAAAAPMTHPQGEYLDLRSSPGLRTWVRTGADSARVQFQFHHACCDGLAALQFVQDLLGNYRIAAGEDPQQVPLRPIDPDLLQRRGHIASDEPRKATWFTGLRDAWYTARVWNWILTRTPAPLAAGNPEAADDPAPADVLAYETAVLDRQESADLRRLAAQLKVTVNDLMLRDLLLVTARWNEDHGEPGRQRLRINVPVNVRIRADAAMPAANRIGYGFVRAESDNRDPSRLLEVVRGETGRIKDWKLGLYFLGGVALARNIPGLLRRVLRRNRSFATVVLSNVGRFVADATCKGREDQWSCGDLVLEGVSGVPPIRKLTRAAAIVIEYAGRTSLCLRCDPRYFSVADTRALLEEFACEIRATLRRQA